MARTIFVSYLKEFVLYRNGERRVWQQITDIFAECTIDYDKNYLSEKQTRQLEEMYRIAEQI